MQLIACLFLLSITTLLVAASSSKSKHHSHPADRFKEHKAKYKRNYSKSEELVRLGLFTLADQDIEKHNKNPHKSYEQGHSHISDWTEEEKQSLSRALDATPGHAVSDRYDFEIDERAYPISLNLVNSTKCVGAVKNQGRCGSCYAFSAIATLEYSYCMLHNQTYVDLSEQQIVDCDNVQEAMYGPGAGGCNGGNYLYVWKYLSAPGGSEPTSVYGAYTAGSTKKNATCKFSAAGVKAKVSSTSLVYGNATTMIAALNSKGVISVSLYVTSNFHRYKSGIFSSDPLCPTTPCPDRVSCRTNHAVALVGYGTENGIDFWIIRNSYGANWGEAGYVRIKRGVNLCNIENRMAYAIAQL